MLKNNFHCSRVKSLCFHPYRHWLLCGLYSGAITIFDYRLDVVVDIFVEHEGSVRAVDFHKTQPLFVSGGDDFVVKVWNYNLRRCLFTLYGHTDYIRSTFFHLQHPWIVSASDDYSIRIWNWQSRTCMATLQGHKHFVMCARFYNHPYIISCSLDKSIRVWNIGPIQEQGRGDFGLAEFLGVSDISVEFESHSHEKGVNWVDCQLNDNPLFPNLYTETIASGADDGRVCVYTFQPDCLKRSLFCEPSLRHHSDNVCSVLFHRNAIISCSEDRTIRVFKIIDNRMVQKSIVNAEKTNRYWMLASCSSRNLFAAGHDSGFEIYKFERERPVFAVKGSKVWRKLNFTSAAEIHLQCTDMDNSETKEIVLSKPNFHTPPSHDAKEQLYVVDDNHLNFLFPTTGDAAFYAISSGGQKSTSIRASFLAPGAPGKLIALRNDGLFTLPENTALKASFKPSAIFRSAPGTILCAVENKILLYHLAQRTVIAEIIAPDVKYVEWDKKMQRVALMAKNTITLATRSLKLLTVVTEVSARVKSAVFDDTFDVLYFSTSYNLKYCNLFNYEVSTICAIRNAIYLIKASVDKIWYFSRYSTEVLVKELDNSELIFKQKLHQRAYREVIQILSRGKLKGQALVGYLHQKNYSEVALQIEKDPLTRFYLALSCGEMEVAKQTAEQLDNCNVWKKLSEAALAYGDIHLAKMASTRGGNYRYTAFLALITGDTTAAAPLADSTKDEHFQMQQAIYANDTRQRIRMLADAGQLSLAYLTARSSNLEDLAEVLSTSMNPQVVQRLSQVPCTAPPSLPNAVGPSDAVTPMLDNWPMLRVESSIFSRMLKDPTLTSTLEVATEVELGDAMNGWGEEDTLATEPGSGEGGRPDGSVGSPGGSKDSNAWNEDAGDAWGEEDLGIDVNATLSRAKISGQKTVYVTPNVHPPMEKQWEHSPHPTDLLLAGAFEEALALLKKQIGLSNPKPLIPVIQYMWCAVNVARPAWKVPSIAFSLTTCGDVSAKTSRPVPSLPNLQELLKEKVNQGFQLFVGAKFNAALATFKSLLHYSVFLNPLESPSGLTEIMEIRQRGAEYARALRLQIQLKQEDVNSPRALELALYFTHFKLFRPHMILALSQAMVKSFKLKHFRTAAAVGRRLLDLEPPKPKADQASAIVFEGETKEDRTDIAYDGLNPFELCCVSFTPMYKGSATPIYCPYCKAPALPEYKKTLCPVCELSLLGITETPTWEDA